MSRYSLDSLISEYEEKKETEAKNRQNKQDLIFLRKKEELEEAINCKKAVASSYMQRMQDLYDSLPDHTKAQELLEKAECYYKNFVNDLEKLNPEFNSPKDVLILFQEYQNNIFSLNENHIFHIVRLVERLMRSFESLNVYEDLIDHNEASIRLIYSKGKELDYPNSTYDEDRVVYYQRFQVLNQSGISIDELCVFELSKMERYCTPESEVGYVDINDFMNEFVMTLKNMIEGLDVITRQDDNLWKLILKKKKKSKKPKQP